MARMRIVGWRVQPIIFADDGENLTEVEVVARVIKAIDWAAFKAGGDEVGLAQVRTQIEEEPKPPDLDRFLTSPSLEG